MVIDDAAMAKINELIDEIGDVLDLHAAANPAPNEGSIQTTALVAIVGNLCVGQPDPGAAFLTFTENVRKYMNEIKRRRGASRVAPLLPRR